MCTKNNIMYFKFKHTNLFFYIIYKKIVLTFWVHKINCVKNNDNYLCCLSLWDNVPSWLFFCNGYVGHEKNYFFRKCTYIHVCVCVCFYTFNRKIMNISTVKINVFANIYITSKTKIYKKKKIDNYNVWLLETVHLRFFTIH